MADTANTSPVLTDQAAPTLVQVQLSAAGRRVAGDGAVLHVVTADAEYRVAASAPLDVTLDHWRKVLSVVDCGTGEAVFELVPPAVAAAATSPVATNTASSTEDSNSHGV